MKVLIINSYAGSLTIAAHRERHEVVGSYEDTGYGLEVQRENFPHLDYRARTEDWPRRLDLSEVVVLAHPPCSAFSQMTPRYMDPAGGRLTGRTSAAFACTEQVLDYVTKRRALAVAIESVVPALDGARVVHERFARERGYDLFRVLQNAATFGLPQWRQRFWAIFVRRGALRDGGLGLDHRPGPPVPFGSVVQRAGEVIALDQKDVDDQFTHIAKVLGRSFAARLRTGDYAYGNFPGLIERRFRELGRLHLVKTDTCKTGKQYEPGTRGAVAREHCWRGPFFSNCLRVLDPAELAPVVLANSWWMVRGRALFREEYKLVMGFPASYKFPGATLGKFREYLSKGVCPPVARWLLKQLVQNLERRATCGVLVTPGHVLDLRPTRGEYRAAEG